MKLKELLEQYGEYEIVNLDELKRQIEKPKSKNVWELEDGDEDFILLDSGRVYNSEWKNTPYEQDIRKQGCIFLTREEAHEEAKRREVYMIVKKYAHNFTKEEWKNGKMPKYFPFYDSYNQYLGINCAYLVKYGQLVFENKKDIEKAIAEVGKEDFIRYYLGGEMADEQFEPNTTLYDWLRHNNYDVRKDLLIELENFRIKSDMADMGLQRGDCSDEYINALLKDIERSRNKINKIKEEYLKENPNADWDKEVNYIKKQSNGVK